MQARRILLFFGIVLLLTAAATSFVPVPEEERREDTETSTTETAEPPPEFRPDRDDAVEIEFEVGGSPRTVDIETGEHVILTVEAKEPGQVELVGLGRIQTVDPAAPAVFDLFTEHRGLFDVVYTSVEGSERTIATVEVGPGRSQTSSPRRDGMAAGD